MFNLAIYSHGFGDNGDIFRAIEWCLQSSGKHFQNDFVYTSTFLFQQ